MKKFYYILCFFMLTTLGLDAQKVDYDISSKWFLGLNLGGTWQSSDVTNNTNVGYGFTLGKSYNYAYGKPFSFDIRGRYLGGYWYGQDLSKTDAAGYSGTTLKPYMDSLGFGVNNFQAQNHEVSLELVLHANRLTEKTGFDPYIFGGIGLVWNQTYGDLRFGDTIAGSGGIYNYDPNQIGSSSYLFNLHDGQYETNLEGTSADIDKWNIDFMPSLGFGLGYRVGKRATIGLEHKTTFTLRDDYDGFTSAIRSKNDWYHYTSLYINFRFRARGTTSLNDNNNNVNNINNFNSNCLTPEVVFTSPFNNSTNVSTNGGFYTVKASVKNLETAQGLSFKVNGVNVTNFIFKPEIDYFEANVYLSSGTNNLQLTGINDCGQDQETTQIVYTQCYAPIVAFTNPNVVGSVVENQTYTVQASISNLNGGQLSVSHNNNPVYNYNLDANSGILSFTVYLTTGENTFSINASNDCGSVVSSSYIRYERCLSPTIYSNSLNASGITVSSQSFNFSAIVNYASSNQISVTQNNQLITNFSYNSLTGQVDKAVFLNPGLNTFVITATNACGTTTQTYIVNYTRDCVNPIVNINSIANNSLVYNADLAFSAQVLNVLNAGGITLSINGINIQNFNFNTATGSVYGSLVLVPGVNTIVLRATNDCGTVTQTIAVNYQTCNLPVITSINPSTDISSVNTSVFNLEAIITNLTSQQDVTLNLNGQNLSNFNFLPNGTINANLTLNLGSNVLIVYAQNNCGSISKTYVIERLTCNAPAILLTNTLVSGSTTTSSQYNLLGTVANVSSVNGITVTLNGQVVNNISFNATTGQISKTFTLSPGYNTIIVSAVNTCGSVSESYSINYQNCTAPTISTITPSSLNSSVNNEAFTFSANIGNVTQAQGISVTLNGQAVTNYNFSSATGRVSGTLNLSPGSNTIVITATNPCGTVSETISVNFLNCKSPVLNISSPVILNSTVSAEDFAVSASITNITNAQGVTITLNGQIVSNGFTPTTGKVSALFKLIPGQNTIVITATNDCGTATQTILVNYQNCTAPTISTITPSSLNSSVNNEAFTFSANIGNITQSQGVTVTLNGQAVTNYNFSSATGRVSGTLNLNPGSNTIVITATNPCGTVSETISVNFLNCKSPVLNISSPFSLNSTVDSEDFAVSASITNITNAQGVTITLNGQIVSNGFTPTTGKVSALFKLIPGQNKIVITATNDCGTATETILVNYQNCTAPTISTITPSSLNSSVNNESFTFSANIGNVTQSQGVTVTLNGQAVTNYNFSSATGRVSGTLNLNPGSNTIVITATNPCGTVSETISVNFLNCKSPVLNISSPVSLNSTVDSEDFAVSASISNVTNAQGVTITLNGQIVSNGFTPTTGKVSALFKLIAGQNAIVITVTNDCGTATQTITVTYNPAPTVEEEKITICHYPPGNNGNPQTLEIPISAWPAHQAHGDVVGPCVEIPNENGNNQNGNGNSGGNSENQNGNSGSGSNGNNNSENGNNGSNGSGNAGNNGSGNGNGGNKQVEKDTKPEVKPDVNPPVKTEIKEEKPENTPKPAAPVTPKGKGGG
jgi:hypothetical protein